MHVEGGRTGQGPVGHRAPGLLHAGHGVAETAQIEAAAIHHHGTGVRQSIRCTQGQGTGIHRGGAGEGVGA